MSFTDKQRRALRAKLSWRHVKTRAGQAGTIAYVEGWHTIAEANRIFGHDCWDRATLSPRCLWSETQRAQTACFYSTKVRITVRAGGSVVTREGIGTGFGRSASPEAAHEMALKAAETDATKRALATFGNPFGLALYDRDQAHVTKPPKDRSGDRIEIQAPPVDGTHSGDPQKDLVLRNGDRRLPFKNVEAFVAATLRAIPGLSTIEGVYAFWEANLDAFKEVRRRMGDSESDPVVAIIATLKGRARALGYPGSETTPASGDARDREGARPMRTTPAASEAGDIGGGLAIPKEQRLRSREHQAFVARQACVVCGRRPAQAHHLRFAQPRAMAMKVSDEFTVPLCVAHHDALHRTGDEQAWWARHGIIDPLKIAAKLWQASRGLEETAKVEDEGDDSNLPRSSIGSADAAE